MEADLIFHNVGQGLFYSGQIRCNDEPNFNFVYDCGGIEKYPSQKSLTLDTCIRRYKKYLQEQPIDMLVISHFHNDHTNGIPTLLNKRHVKTVIIPFFTFEERLSILLSEYHSKMTDAQILFLLDPYRFLIKKDVQKIIVMIHNHNDNDGMDNQGARDLDNLQSNIPDLPEYNEIRAFNNNHNNQILVITDNEPIKKACWSFAFFADDRHKSTFDPSIAEQGIDNLQKATTEADRKAAIKHIKDSYGIKKSSDFNETSLIMIHKFDSQLNHIYPFLYHSHPKHYRFRRCSHILRETFNHVHVLTGDFNFKNESWNDVKNHFGAFLGADASIKQIAHHGSIDNWDKDILTHTQNNNLCVIPYGTKNTYGHPALNVIKDIVTSHEYLFEVTEYQSLMLFYKS